MSAEQQPVRMDHTSPEAVQRRLADIEFDLACRQGPYEQAATDRARAIRDWEKRLAIHGKVAKGTSDSVRKANALSGAIMEDWNDGDGTSLYERLTDAEAMYDAQRVVVR